MPRMNARQFTSALKRLRMNVSGAARFFGVHRRSIRRYKNGELKVPEPIEMLLAIMETYRIDPNYARELAKLDPVLLDTPSGRPFPEDDSDDD